MLWLPFQLVVLVNLFFTLGTFGARLEELGPAFCEGDLSSITDHNNMERQQLFNAYRWPDNS